MRNISLLVIVSSLAASPGVAANVDLTGAVVNTCTITLTAAGTLGLSSLNAVLGSEETGGVPATFGVSSVGLAPLVSFAAPSLVSSPGGWVNSHTEQIKFTSTGGANQAYTASAATYQMTAFTDAFTVNGRVNAAAGFATGTYVMRTVVTCSQ